MGDELTPKQILERTIDYVDKFLGELSKMQKTILKSEINYLSNSYEAQLLSAQKKIEAQGKAIEKLREQ